MAYTYREVKGSPLTHAEYDENWATAEAQYDAALAAADSAEKWAEEAEDTEVVTGSYSAFHWAQKSQEWANSITTDVAEAEAARDAAVVAQNAAEGYAANALTYQDQAEVYKNNAETSATNSLASAELSEDWAIQPEDVEVQPGYYSALHYAEKSAAESLEALNAKIAAETAEDNAAASEIAAGNSETAAANAATAAGLSEAKAEDWATETIDVEVEPGLYSSLHYASKSYDSAVAADGFQAMAEGYAGDAQDWASEAVDVEVALGEYSSKHYASKANDSRIIAVAAANAAEVHKLKAQDWAEEAEDVEVETGKYSALHWSAKSEGFATTAEAAIDDAQKIVGVDVHDFGAVGDGTTNDRNAIQAAIDSLGVAGGVVSFHRDKKYYLGTSLTVKKNVALVGTHRFVGSPGDNFDAPYDEMGCTLIIHPTYSVFMNSNSSLSGFLVHRSGMTFPTLDASAFAGTAFTINGEDVALSNSLVLGFNKAVYSTGHQRQRIYDFWMDCNNGIHIENNLDISYISRCHAWPFATIEAVANSISTNGGSDLTRSGVAYKFANTVDWTKVTDCFSYGYYQGFRLDAVNSCTLLNCSADNISAAGVPTHTGSSGFYVNGHENRLIGCQAAAQQAYGIAVESTAGSVTIIESPVIWVAGDHSCLFQAGDVVMTNAVIRDSSGNGVTMVGVNDRMTINNTYFRNVPGYEWNFVGAHDTSKKLIGKYTTNRTSEDIIGGTGSFTAAAVVAVDPLVIPSQGEVFNISGNTSFGQLAYGYAGRKVTLVFSGTPTVYNATGTVNNMRLSSNFVAAAGRTLTLIHNGTQWYEVGRS